MWLQLISKGKRKLIGFASIGCWFLLLGNLQAQQFDSTTFRPVDVDFLFTYYNQSGDHAAVTGGIDSEKLTDNAGKILINVPMDSLTQIQVDMAANRYSSASTDQIDNNMSSASSADSRLQLKLGFTKQTAKRQSFSANLSGSIESDYISTGLGGTWKVNSLDQNKQFSISAQAFFDNWILYFPKELRDSAQPTINTSKRRSYSLSFTYNSVINKRLKAAIFSDIIYQKGLLSTPFHRVYFQEQDRAKIEHFPSSRIKFPIGIRANYFISDFLILRSYYRFYWDSFGILGQTFSLTMPVKLGSSWTVYPSYRFHFQSASKYFSPYKEHVLTDEYYTSDYDLSKFNSHKFGLGLVFSPFLSLRRKDGNSSKINRLQLKSISGRFVYYNRTDGLEYYSINTGISVSF